MVKALKVPFATEQRHVRRVQVALPVLLYCDGNKYAATVFNLSSHGAMIRSSLQCRVGAAVVISCGTAETLANVAWSGVAHAGLAFTQTLSEPEVAEHVARSKAIAARRARKSANLGAPCTPAGTVTTTSSTAPNHSNELRSARPLD